MAMVSTHGAPQVTYPAGRWRFYPYLLALVWLLQLAWASQPMRWATERPGRCYGPCLP